MLSGIAVQENKSSSGWRCIQLARAEETHHHGQPHGYSFHKNFTPILSSDRKLPPSSPSVRPQPVPERLAVQLLPIFASVKGINRVVLFVRTLVWSGRRLSATLVPMFRIIWPTQTVSGFLMQFPIKRLSSLFELSCKIIEDSILAPMILRIHWQ